MSAFAIFLSVDVFAEVTVFVSHDCSDPVEVLYRIPQLRNKFPRFPVADDDI